MAYEFDGRQYEKASGHQKEWGTKLIQELELKGNERILDLGCGDGGLTAQLARRVPTGSILGIDASRGMIDTAKRHVANNLRFEIKDINTLDWENEFDVIFSNSTLHWIKDHRDLLVRVFRSLQHGGIIRFNFAADGNCSHLLNVIKKAMTLPQYDPYFDDFDWPWFMPTVKEYEYLMRRSDFADFQIWCENADHFFPDTEAMIRWVDQPSLVPFLERIPERNKQGFRDLVVERMVQETRREDGTCFETFRRINVLARKE